MEILAISVAAAIASAAWLYQRSWERQEQRIQRYQEILDRLPAFVVGREDAQRKDETIQELRRLWLSAPDHVVHAAENFLDSLEGIGSDDKAVALGKCVVAMRRDATMASALLPRFWKTRLVTSDFRLRHAR